MRSTKTSVSLSNPHPVLANTEVFRTFNYAPAVAAGGLLFIAGQIGIRADGTVPASVEEQIDLAFQRLGAIMQAAGLGFADLVEVVSCHVDVDKQLAAFREIKDRYIKADAPTWTIRTQIIRTPGQIPGSADLQGASRSEVTVRSGRAGKQPAAALSRG